MTLRSVLYHISGSQEVIYSSAQVRIPINRPVQKNAPELNQMNLP